METAKLKKFAQFARRSLLEQIGSKLKLVLASESSARREHPAAVKKLEAAIQESSQEHVIDRVAYIWFNRFCALRFMDINHFNRVNIVSPADAGQFQPEILAEAKMGHIDDEMVPEKVRLQIFALLDGKAPSHDPQGEAYRLLVVAACNFWNRAMPFLFQRIDDYTELLMPDDLLSGNSILAYTREAMTPETCEDVEVIGWLYQFYISEKKDAIFDGLKKGKKITSENIPAATQLFTPHWIVRYLVENSLGRLWLLNRPGSKLAGQMEYYIKPEQRESDFLRITKPEEIKICDPACGSGHMLTYAFDLLYAIYEEEGYEPAEIPSLILIHNLYGIEIDERAGELAAFALTMKARAKQRRFFNKSVKPNICVLENVHFDEGELNEYMDFVGRDLLTSPLQTTLRQFEEVNNFGSLIRPELTDVVGVMQALEAKDVSGQLFLKATHDKVLQTLRQAEYLSHKYHIVIANPPYMGSKGMNGRLGLWAKDNYPNSKSDLFAMFIERNLDLAQKLGTVAMITMQSWMFLSTLERLRTHLLESNTFLTMAHLGANAFDSIGGEVVQTTAFVLLKHRDYLYKGEYVRLSDGNSESDKQKGFNRSKVDRSLRFKASASDFAVIPGSPIAYWANPKLLNIFASSCKISDHFSPKTGMTTGDDNRFLRLWHEPSISNENFNLDSSLQTMESCVKWVPYNKGGISERWYGNSGVVVNWENDGDEIKKWVVNNPNDPNTTSWSRRVFNHEYFFRPGITWTLLNSNGINIRLLPAGSILNVNGPTISIDDNKKAFFLAGSLNSVISSRLMSFINPTLANNPGNVGNMPLLKGDEERVYQIVNSILDLAKSNWDSIETAWSFASPPLLNSSYLQPTLIATYQKLRAQWREMTLEMQRLEEENNRIFIEAYDLQNELSPEVPLAEITLTCNPHYRYGGDKNEDEREALLLADTLRELVSYSVGCMFGRYSLDKPGLILANQGETLVDYLKRVPQPSFPADADNVIPMLDGYWFTDDIAERFCKFLRVVFGEEHYEENLRFVEQGLNIKGKRNYSIRDYFVNEFYSDHVKRYKKRPIYWLFSSPKGSFNALIYMHRYRPDTVSVVLNDYLREFRTKLTAHKNHLQAVSISGSASQGEKTKALKEIEKITKMIAELEEYEREVLYPLATEQVAIDLDDGVKVNYPKLGTALKKIVGLDASED